MDSREPCRASTRPGGAVLAAARAVLALTRAVLVAARAVLVATPSREGRRRKFGLEAVSPTLGTGLARTGTNTEKKNLTRNSELVAPRVELHGQPWRTTSPAMWFRALSFASTTCAARARPPSSASCLSLSRRAYKTQTREGGRHKIPAWRRGTREAEPTGHINAQSAWTQIPLSAAKAPLLVGGRP